MGWNASLCSVLSKKLSKTVMRPSQSWSVLAAVISKVVIKKTERSVLRSQIVKHNQTQYITTLIQVGWLSILFFSWLKTDTSYLRLSALKGHTVLDSCLHIDFTKLKKNVCSLYISSYCPSHVHIIILSLYLDVFTSIICCTLPRHCSRTTTKMCWPWHYTHLFVHSQLTLYEAEPL